jgi:hypothetical protein
MKRPSTNHFFQYSDNNFRFRRAGLNQLGSIQMQKTFSRSHGAHSTNPMKTITLLTLMLISTLPVSAGISSGSSGPLVVVAAPEPRPVAVAMTLPADFVSVPLRITSGQKNTALAYEESRQALELISQKAAENGQLKASTGVVTLSQHRGGFGISSGPWSEPAATAEIHLLVRLTKERDNIFTAGAEAARFLDGLKLPGKVRCELGGLRLALENPEQYRTNLLAQIAQEMKTNRSALGATGSIRVDGLEGSVLVRQADDRHVEVFLNYNLSIMWPN